MAYFHFLVLALNSLVIAVMLGVAIPMIFVERSFLPIFLFLLILAPFVMLVVYAIFRRGLLIWWISLLGNVLMAFFVGFLVMCSAKFIDKGESSMSAMILQQVLFLGVITVLNVFYLLGNRQPLR